MLKIGSEAPDFSVPLHTGQMFRLSEYRGRNNVVLFFYPKDFTTGCTAEACAFSDHLDEMSGQSAVVIGISADSTQRHLEFAKEKHLRFPLGSDENRSVMKLYGAVRFGMPLRVTYVIDKSGLIRGAAHHEILISNHLQSAISVLRDIEAKK